jgi:hypothetical protein
MEPIGCGAGGSMYFRVVSSSRKHRFSSVKGETSESGDWRGDRFSSHHLCARIGQPQRLRWMPPAVPGAKRFGDLWAAEPISRMREPRSSSRDGAVTDG